MSEKSSWINEYSNFEDKSNMRFKGDTSGLDEFERQIEDKYYSKLIEIGKESIRIAQNARGGNGLKAYQNHTFNLRNAPGACVRPNIPMCFFWNKLHFFRHFASFFQK